MRRWGRRKANKNRGGSGNHKQQPKQSSMQMQVEGKKVAILTPVNDLCHTGYAMSLAHMVKHTLLQIPANLEALTVNSYGTSILPFSRQVLAKTALEQGVTHMLWIDSDMEFPSDMLLRFLRYDHPLIGINAMTRRPPYRNTAQSDPGTALETNADSTGLEKVFRMGFGVVWMESRVVEQMELPWFDFEYVPDLGCFRGEDYYFFEKAKALGFECLVDHDLSKQVKHIGSFAFNPLLASEAAVMTEKLR